MAKPLRSDDPNPKDVSFSHFGVLDDGARSKGAAVTSIVINGLVLAVILILGAVVKTNPALARKIAAIALPNKPPPPEQPKPKPPPPPPKPLPQPPRIQPPKITPPPMPEKVPEMKPIVVPVPKPVILAPAPPKRVSPPPAPVKVNLAVAHAASVANHDEHPTAIRLGNTTNPLKSLSGPAVASVNLGNRGAPGMPSTNTGNGARKVSLGSGAPGSHDMNGHDNGAPVRGVRLGVPGGTGPLNSRNYANAPVNVQLQRAPPPQAVATHIESTEIASPPTVTYKPEPVYTAEAKAMHLEGTVSLRIRVTASGEVEVLGITHSLGHGLDESAREATEHTRFKPARNAAGNPVDWTGVVVVRFQLS